MQSPLSFEIGDSPPIKVTVGIHEIVGASAGADVVRELAPLLFSAAFKVLDMVIEWCLVENGVSPHRSFFSFVEKIRQYRSGAIVTWPDFLGADAHLQYVIGETYEFVRPKRNAIVHGSWGMIQSGELSFDFQYIDDLDPSRPTRHDTDHVNLGVNSSFCEFASFLFDRMVDPSKQLASDAATLKRMANSFQQLHHQPLQALPDQRFYRVIRKTSQDFIDVTAIIDRALKPQAGSASIVFDLEIERGNEHWIVPANATAHLPSVVSLSDLSKFKQKS